MRAGSCSNWAVMKTISHPAACTRLSRSRSRLSAYSSPSRLRVQAGQHEPYPDPRLRPGFSPGIGEFNGAAGKHNSFVRTSLEQRRDLRQRHQAVSEHGIEVGDSVRQRLIEQQVERCPQWSRDRDFGPRRALVGSYKGPPHIQAGAPRDAGAVGNRDMNAILSTRQLHPPQSGRRSAGDHRFIWQRKCGGRTAQLMRHRPITERVNTLEQPPHCWPSQLTAGEGARQHRIGALENRCRLTKLDLSRHARTMLPPVPLLKASIHTSLKLPTVSFRPTAIRLRMTLFAGARTAIRLRMAAADVNGFS
jgi:hypothetical protein